jgi:ribosomal protein S18 acetylase RimI-like enzyme
MDRDPRLPEVRTAQRSEIDGIAGAMARAFADDPALGFLLGEGRREERLTRFFAAELEHVAFPHEIVWTTDGLLGGAIWAKPGHWRVPVAATIRETPDMLPVFGRRLGLAVWTRLRMERLHPKRPESYYLAAIGLDPSQQGRGLGSALMSPMLERMDSERTAAYLEASSTRSRALYERHGFVTTGEIRLPRGGPPIWPMWRDPR